MGTCQVPEKVFWFQDKDPAVWKHLHTHTHAQFVLSVNPFLLFIQQAYSFNLNNSSPISLPAYFFYWSKIEGTSLVFSSHINTIYHMHTHIKTEIQTSAHISKSSADTVMHTLNAQTKNKARFEFIKTVTVTTSQIIP